MPHFYSAENIIFPGVKIDWTKKTSELIVHFDFTHLETDHYFGFSKDKLDLTSDQLTREIGLWNSTCFEIFLKNIDGDDYYELNFSPLEKKWNGFYFTHYRSTLQETNQLQILSTTFCSDYLKLLIKIPDGNFECFPKIILFPKKTYLAAIYLSTLKHPPNGPDFHVFSGT